MKGKIPIAMLVMLSKFSLAIACLILSGCTVILHPIATSEISELPTHANVSASDIAALSEGSRVIINRKQSANNHNEIVGTVLKTSPQGIALMNCENHSRTERGVPVLNKVPYASRLFKNSGVGVERVPVLWVSIRDISTVSVIEAPPSNYVAPQLPLDTNDEVYFERIGIDFNFNGPPSPAS